MKNGATAFLTVHRKTSLASAAIIFVRSHINFGKTALLEAHSNPVFFFLIKRQNRFSHEAGFENASLNQRFLQTGMSFTGRLAAAIDSWEIG